MPPVRLIAIDIDGTLLDSTGRVPDANRDAIAAAAARGIHIAIATGRSFSFTLPAVEPLADPLTLIVHNGAITRARDLRTFDRRLLPAPAAAAVLDVTREWRHSTMLLFDRTGEGQMVFDQMDWAHPDRVRFHERNRGAIMGVLALEEALDEDPVQVAFNGSIVAMRAVVAAVRSLAIAPPLSISVTEYPGRDFSLVDVCAEGTTKGAALARLAARLGIEREAVMAVGDNHNDLDMLEWAGVGVVMGNAEAELRARGLLETSSHDQAGLAYAIRKWALYSSGTGVR